MRFYRENKINPAASCLPLLAQAPVFISLYLVLRNFSKHVPAGSDLSWLHFVPDITAKANSGWYGYVLLATYAASQVFSTYFMSQAMDKLQRRLMMVLPLVFITVIAHFPIGLVIYWVTTNLWTVGQGLVTRRLVPKTPGGPGPSGPKRSSRTPSPSSDGDSGNGAKTAPEPKPRPSPRRACAEAAAALDPAAPREAEQGPRPAMSEPHRRGDRRDRRRGEVAGAARARAPRSVARQGLGAVPGALGGRARAARRRLHARARGRHRPRGGRRSRAGSASTRASAAAQLREVLEHVTAAIGVRCRIEIAETEESLEATCYGDDLGPPDRPPRADDRRDPGARVGDRRRLRRRAPGGGRRRGRLPRPPPPDARVPGPAERGGGGAHGLRVELEPMSAAERKIVHTALQDRDGRHDHERGRGAQPLVSSSCLRDAISTPGSQPSSRRRA